MFPSISHLFLRWRGPKSIANLDGGHVRDCPVESVYPPLTRRDCLLVVLSDLDVEKLSGVAWHPIS